jgi:hypothetical protein
MLERSVSAARWSRWYRLPTVCVGAWPKIADVHPSGSGRLVLAALAAAIVAAALSGCGGSGGPAGVVTLSQPSGAPSAPVRVLKLATVLGPVTSSSTKLTQAACPTGSSTSGGGIATILAGGGTPSSSLHVDGTAPAGPGMRSINSSGAVAAGWRALGATGGQDVVGGVTTVYAICLRGKAFGHPARIVVARVAGPVVAARTARATATCPAGSILLGGGGETQVTSGGNSPSLRLIGSYPSNAAGAALPDGARSPASWSALADSGGQGDPHVATTAFALCASVPGAQTTVAMASRPGPLPAGSATPATANCPPRAVLISGGAEAGPRSGLPQQGLHLTGSFPSSAAGVGVRDRHGADSANSWTARAESGGQGSPAGTFTTAFAVCLS